LKQETCPSPYQLGWVLKDGPRLMVTWRCAVTFAIGPFRDSVLCDVSPLDCADFLLGIPYQEQRDAVYHARIHQYHLKQDSSTYVLTSSSLKAPPLLTGQAAVRRVSLNKYISLRFVRPIQPDQPPQSLAPDMATLLS